MTKLEKLQLFLKALEKYPEPEYLVIGLIERSPWYYYTVIDKNPVGKSTPRCSCTREEFSSVMTKPHHANCDWTVGWNHLAPPELRNILGENHSDHPGYYEYYMSSSSSDNYIGML